MIRIPTISHFAFSPLLNVQVCESFVRGNRVFAGVQWEGWQADTLYWNERTGAYRGAGISPVRSLVSDLRVLGADMDATAFDPVARVAGGVSARGTLASGDFGGAIDAGNIEYRLYSCATGENVAVSATGEFGDLAEGSYIVWARPWRGAVGGHFTQCGEWSALRLVVGVGNWQVAPGGVAGPGPCLYAKDADADEVTLDASNASAGAVLFDPLWRAVTASDITSVECRRRDGTISVPAGTQLVAGLRASRNGPMAALGVLRSDDTLRLLGVNPALSTGICECGKTRHHATDIAQDEDGALYLLNECGIHRFDADADDVRDALPGWPQATGGHPGGHALRILQGVIHAWTENFQNSDGDEKRWYNRLLRRVAGVDRVGPSSVWHGPNCAELFQGRLWAFRQDEDFDNPGARVWLDWLVGGQWSRQSPIWRPAGAEEGEYETHLQRLRRRGNNLLLFGYRKLRGEETVEQPVCEVSDGHKLRAGQLDYFVYRATTSPGEGGETLTICARHESEGIGDSTQSNDGDGPPWLGWERALRVVELPQQGTRGGTHFCSFWNDETGAFVMSATAFVAAGGDVAKLPRFYRWRVQTGADGGGVWVASEAAPDNGYSLSFSQVGDELRFTPGADGLPFDASLWGLLCFEILADGSVEGPFVEPSCPHAQCVLDKMPPGTKARFFRLDAESDAPVLAAQIADLNRDKRLFAARGVYPNLWIRADSESAPYDLTSYTRLARYRWLELLEPGATRVEGVVLIAPSDAQDGECELPDIVQFA